MPFFGKLSPSGQNLNIWKFGSYNKDRQRTEYMRKKKILLVDDDPVIRLALSQHLSNQGHDVIALSDGKSCLEELTRQKADLIILDATLPGISGPDVLDSLKSNPHTAAIPVVMLSSDTETQGMASSGKFSAESYLAKPLSVSAILRAINTIEEAKEATKALERLGGD